MWTPAEYALPRRSGVHMRMRSASIVLIGFSLAVGLSGCGLEAAEPRASTTTAPTPSEPAVPAEPEIPPADGETLEIQALTLHLIEDLRWLRPESGELTVSAAALMDDGHPVTVTISDLPAVQSDLDLNAQAFLDVSANDPKPTRLDDRTVDGVDAWTAEAADDLMHSLWLGGIHEDRQWTVEIQTPVTMSEDDAHLLRERVIASIEFA
ncbi:hypothetical protein MUN77_15435 [Leucobacter allii]|uniref:hypothetical protein n=1 Tax=Leucobacter allii TaxID=2932247 RepID=UPI001FD19E74|nr:hypothetical protein [Leucobacter allii]UOR01500.1 hypothetical protein MUN77_15435 [Leucobacter allii]